MSTFSYYQMTDRDLEDQADFVKCKVLAALVKDGLISEDDAEAWAVEHTLIKRKKGFFRTLTDKWKKEKEIDNEHFWIVVKKI